MIVVDTNIVSYLYLSGVRSHQSEALLQLDSHWCAPVLWRSEFGNVLSLYLRKGLLTLADVLLILKQAEELLGDDEYNVPSADVMEMVSRSNCSAYDCEFVALAKYLDVPFITADKKLLKQFPKIAKSLDLF